MLGLTCCWSAGEKWCPLSHCLVKRETHGEGCATRCWSLCCELLSRRLGHRLLLIIVTQIPGARAYRETAHRQVLGERRKLFGCGDCINTLEDSIRAHQRVLRSTLYSWTSSVKRICPTWCPLPSNRSTLFGPR